MGKSETERVVGQFAYIKCECGPHMVDLFDSKWNDKKLGFYTCNSCDRPLICRGDDGFHYFIGERVVGR